MRASSALPHECPAHRPHRQGREGYVLSRWSVSAAAPFCEKEAVLSPPSPVNPGSRPMCTRGRDFACKIIPADTFTNLMKRSISFWAKGSPFSGRCFVLVTGGANPPAPDSWNHRAGCCAVSPKHIHTHNQPTCGLGLPSMCRFNIAGGVRQFLGIQNGRDQG